MPLYPVTAGIAGAALAITGLWWNDQGIEGLFMSGRVWTDWELWRALTSTLPHVDLLHLAFNLYWFWVFGTVLERVYGHLRFAGIVVLLALISSLAEFMVLEGGVGLSGVGYGLWGLLCVLEKSDLRFAGTVDAKTSRLFVIWFFLCIVFTISKVMPVANVAHGIGAVTGVLLGLVLTRPQPLKGSALAGLAGILMLTIVGSTVLWPWINHSEYAALEIEHAGWEALSRNDNTNAMRWLELATRRSSGRSDAWYDLGIAYHRLGHYGEAAAAYDHAAQMEGATSDMKLTAEAMKIYLIKGDRR
jgi:membrane associated rhomboid family serine protease